MANWSSFFCWATSPLNNTLKLSRSQTTGTMKGIRAGGLGARPITLVLPTRLLGKRTLPLVTRSSCLMLTSKLRSNNTVRSPSCSHTYSKLMLSWTLKFLITGMTRDIKPSGSGLKSTIHVSPTKLPGKKTHQPATRNKTSWRIVLFKSKSVNTERRRL